MKYYNYQLVWSRISPHKSLCTSPLSYCLFFEINKVALNIHVFADMAIDLSYSNDMCTYHIRFVSNGNTTYNGYKISSIENIISNVSILKQPHQFTCQ